MLYYLFYYYVIFQYYVVNIRGELELDCRIPGNQDVFFVRMDKVDYGDPKQNVEGCDDQGHTEKILGDDLDIGATDCTTFDDYSESRKYVVRSDPGDGDAWMMCVGGKYNTDNAIRVCQIESQCIEKNIFAKTFGKSENGSCALLRDGLNYTEIVTLNSMLQDCGFSAIQREIDFPEHQVESVPADEEVALPSDKPPYHNIHACRRGKYEGVFYDKSGHPTHCIINFEHRDRGKCMNILNLYSAIEHLSSKELERNLADDSTIKYKSYILNNKARLYSKKTDQYFNGLDKKLWDGPENNPSTAFTRLFKEAAILFNETYPEPFTVNIYGIGHIGAKVFCDLALTNFPVKNKVLFKMVPPVPCPKLQQKDFSNNCPASRISADSHDAKVNLVYYKLNSSINILQPTACYFPPSHIDVRDQNNEQKNCMFFDKALDILSKKNNDNEEPKSIKQNYLAGVLRLHTKSLAPYDDDGRSEKFYGFTHMRHGSYKRSFRNLLLDLDTALGYEMSANKMKFKLVGDEYDTQSGEDVLLSPHAFCTAIVEMIPFKQDVIRKNLQNCY